MAQIIPTRSAEICKGRLTKGKKCDNFSEKPYLYGCSFDKNKDKFRKHIFDTKDIPNDCLHKDKQELIYGVKNA